MPLPLHTAPTLLLFFAAGVTAQTTFSGVGDLPGGSWASYCTDISANGQVVIGNSNGIVAQMTGDHAFRWTHASGIVPIVMPAGWQSGSLAVGVSDDGAVMTGNARTGSILQSFVWTSAGAVLNGGLAAGSFNRATDLSGDGSVMVGVGSAMNASGQLADTGTRWTAATGLTVLGWLPNSASCAAAAVSRDSSVICGVCFGGSVPGANYGRIFRWTAASGMTEPAPVPAGYDGWQVSRISADGSVLTGRAIYSDGTHSRMMRWSAGAGFEAFSALPQYANGGGLGISPDGRVILGYVSNGGPSADRAVFWTADTGQVLLDGYLLAHYGFQPPQGWILNRAASISADNRTIVGQGTNPFGLPEGWILTLAWPLGCYANCDSSTQTPTLNAVDFICFMNRFAGGNPYANCDGSTTPPTLNVADYICFINKYAAGCP